MDVSVVGAEIYGLSHVPLCGKFEWHRVDAHVFCISAGLMEFRVFPFQGAG